MSEAIRITPKEARERVLAGKALLICAYTDEAKLAQYHLEGAISLASFRAQAGGLSKDQELIFY